MRKDERDLLEVLKCELEFLERGLYHFAVKFPWRPQFFLEDSPTCPNYVAAGNCRPCSCSDCVLIALVPADFQARDRACRHIPLTSDNETLDSLYRSTDLAETEQVFRDWLRNTITKLEQERQTTVTAAPASANHISKSCEPLFQKLHPKCANPACHAVFQWRGGGRFFRFRPDATDDGKSSWSTGNAERNKARHYWLCERCSQIFTLVFDESLGVVLKVRSAEVEKEPATRRQVHD